MSNLLTFSQQQAIKKLSPNFNTAKFDLLDSEVEITDLKDLIGRALLQDLQDNPATAANLLLLNGDTFTSYLGQPVKHKGIRFVLAYMNYSRYLGESFVQDTYSGMVQKQNDTSERVGEGTIKRLQLSSQEIALSEFELIKEYLTINSTTYPLWLAGTSRKTFTPVFGSVSKTAYGSEVNSRCEYNGKRYIND